MLKHYGTESTFWHRVYNTGLHFGTEFRVYIYILRHGVMSYMFVITYIISFNIVSFVIG